MIQLCCLVMVSALTLYSSWASSDTLCDSQEQTLFSCKSKSKLASLCSSNVFSENTGYIRYLYGKHGEIELEYPNDKSLARKNFKWSRVYSPGVNVYLKFNIGEFKYYVYSSQGESYNSYSGQSGDRSMYHWEGGGVAVFRNSKLFRNIECSDTYKDFLTLKVKDFELAKVPANDETDFNLWEKIP